MDGILTLAIIALFVLPVTGICLLFGLRGRMDNIERALREVGEQLKMLEKREEAAAPLSAEKPFERQSRTPAPPPPAEAPKPRETVLPLPPVRLPSPPIVSPAPEPLKAQEAPVSPPPLPERISADGAAGRSGLPLKPQPASTVKGEPLQLRQPTWLRIQAQCLTTWLLKEGNIWVTSGVVILLLGFGLLFSYMAQMGWFSLELRLASSSAAGVAMTAFGWRLREKRRNYALVLQGGGIGVLYVVLLAGAKLGGPVIPIPAAVMGMVLLSVFTVLLALLQDFEPLAIFALLGGFAAPLLVHTGSANHVALFSIYSLLNLEILAISTRKDWRKSRWGGLIASIAVGSLWGVSSWREAYFTSVEPFIILFFLSYSAIASVPFAPRFKGGARFDFPLTVTLPFAFLFLQMAAASHTKYGIALTCLGLGTWYLALGQFAFKRAAAGIDKNTPRVFLGYCILFSNLAVPFAFKQAVSTTVWALEGAFLIALAARTRRKAALAWGLVLSAAALLLYNFAPYLHLPGWLYPSHAASVGLLNWRSETSPFLLTGLLFALSAFASSYFAGRCDFLGQKERTFGEMKINLPSQDVLAWIFSAYGTIWWWLVVNHAVFVNFSLSRSGVYWGWLSAFAILSAGGAAALLLSKRLNWRAVRAALVPSVALVLLLGRGPLPPSFLFSGNVTYPYIWYNYLCNWSIFTMVFLSAIYVYRDEKAERQNQVAWGVILFAWLRFTGFAFERWVERWNGDWALLISFLPILVAALVFTLDQLEERRFIKGYEGVSHLAIAGMLLINALPFFESFLALGGGFGSFYIPVLNPLELWQLAFLASLFLLLRKREHPQLRRVTLWYIMPALTFLWINQVAARAAWWYFNEMIRFGHMSGASHFQAIIAILWGLTSFTLIFWGKKIPHRGLWFMGAALLALDIAKLLLIDLQNSATIIRIFAFLLLGGLFLFIGWMAPLPPKSTALKTEEEEVQAS